VIFETASTIGDPLGATIDPPIAVTGATSLVFSCDFDNPRNETVRFGLGDQAMCVMLAYTDAGARLATFSTEVHAAGMDGDVHLFESECTTAALRD
jgi:hypothetical protein